MKDKGLPATNEIRLAPKNTNSYTCEFVFFIYGNFSDVEPAQCQIEVRVASALCWENFFQGVTLKSRF